MSYTWNWGIFWEASPEGAGTYLDMLVQGLWLTLATAAGAWTIALGMGVVVGVLRTLPGRAVGILAGAWVELFRNIPLLVQLFLWYFVLPEVLPREAGTWSSTASTVFVPNSHASSTRGASVSWTSQSGITTLSSTWLVPRMPSKNDIAR